MRESPILYLASHRGSLGATIFLLVAMVLLSASPV